MTLVPFDLSPSSKVLVIGAGGGFDFLCGLPIALELASAGHTTHIGSYSFTDLESVVNGKWHSDDLLEINESSGLKEGNYFPELHLARWFEQNGEKRSIWCLTRGGVVPVTRSYDYLIEKLGVDTIICVDGGVDGIFKGDEYDLGTPSMDSISVIATSECKAERKIYACTAFGAEGAEGRMSYAQVLKRIAELVNKDAMLGLGSILKRTASGERFIEAANYIFSAMEPRYKSVIVSSIVAAMKGAHGHSVVNEKTRERPVWLSPLTFLIWYFDATIVAKSKLFYDESIGSVTVEDVANAIEKVRKEHKVQEYEEIPL